MFRCERCGVRFSTGALSGSRTCPRCSARDGVTTMLTWEPLFAARYAAAMARAEARRRPPTSQERDRGVRPGQATREAAKQATAKP